MRRLSLIASLVLFVSIAVWYGRPVDGVWNSPDETANAFWAARVSAGEPLQVIDPIVGLGGGAVHPRSMGVVGDALVPGSFPGIILLYGVFKFLFKLPLFLYTPILTAIAGLCFGLLVTELFDRKVGVWAAVLFLIHPAILYYGTRGMFHNMLFIDALIFAAALFALRPLRTFFGARAMADDALGGFILAWALVIRTSEVIWVIPVFAAFLPFAGKARWRRLAVAIVAGLVPLLVFMRLNATLYGSPFRTAYSPPTSAVVPTPAPKAPGASESVGAAAGTSEFAPALILPFGVHPRLVVRNVWNYGLKLFWWQSILAASGFAWWISRFRKTPAPQKVYALAAVLTAGWLATLYGSWLLRDRFDPTDVTIGTSYVRYFLPAYVAAIPFAALSLVRLGELLHKPRLVSACVILCATLGIRSAVFAGDESLHVVRRTLEDNAMKKVTLLEWIEPEAVVMTERFDKLLVPERLRIIPATDAGAFIIAARAAEFAPVYWYGLDPSVSEAWRLSDLASAHGMVWYEVGSPVTGETLFRLDWSGGEAQDY